MLVLQGVRCTYATMPRMTVIFWDEISPRRCNVWQLSDDAALGVNYFRLGVPTKIDHTWVSPTDAWSIWSVGYWIAGYYILMQYYIVLNKHIAIDVCPLQCQYTILALLCIPKPFRGRQFWSFMCLFHGLKQFSPSGGFWYIYMYIYIHSLYILYKAGTTRYMMNIW